MVPSSTSSTPCAERSMRAVCSSIYGNTSGDTWKLLNEELLLDMIAKEMKQLKSSTQHLGPQNQGATHQEPHPSLLQGLSQPTGQPVNVTKHKLQQQLTHTSTVSDDDLTEDQRWIYFTDSGGQQQFQDVIQAFIPDTSVLLLAFKLIEKLSDHPSEMFVEDGIPYAQGQSALSNEEMLRRQARMLHLHKESALSIACIGTYYDKYLEQQQNGLEVVETIEKKNAILNEIMLPFKDNVLFRDIGMSQCIFPVNGLQAVEGKFDDPVVCELRKVIMNCANTVVDVPIRWHLLELELQRQEQQVLPLEEVVRIANQFEFESREEVTSALQFLSKYNLILYYHSLLPNVVFTSPQVYNFLYIKCI